MTASSHLATVKTVLGEELVLARLHGEERLGRAFRYDLDLLGLRPDIEPQEVLGTDMTVTLKTTAGERYFHGLVVRFACTGRSTSSGRYTAYTAQLRPALWMLSYSSDSRIFQHSTVPEVLEQVLSEFQVSDVENSLSGTYPTCEYLVQYRETAFSFVHRLMEREGIYYFFKHEAGRHILVLSDSVVAHGPLSGYEDVAYFPPGRQGRRDLDHLHTWRHTAEVRPGTYAMADYDFTRPTANLAASASAPKDHPFAEGKLYDYPGGYTQVTQGEAYARARLEEQQVRHQVAHGEGTARGMAAGSLFRLQEFPVEGYNKEYLIVRVVHDLVVGTFESGAGEASSYGCQIEAIDSYTPYRLPRTTPWPLIGGPQTATVVTEGGEEVTTDEYGRVKVQFHWDREGQNDQNSSCYVRVAQAWAGSGFGAVFIPRKDQEVIVEFLEGDPDQPIVTGSVYNADNMPPYGLPANRTQSGIKTHSSVGAPADKFNELRFEDKVGEEQVFMQAEKNLDVNVKRDATHTVGNNEGRSVGADRDRSVGGNESVSVGSNQSLSVGGNRDKSVSGNESNSIAKAYSLDVGTNATLSIGSNMSVSVSKNETHSVQGGRTSTVSKDDSTQVNGKRTTTVAKDDVLDVAKKILVNAGDQLTIKVGAASLTMKKDGTITLKGKDIRLDGSGKITVKASGALTLKGSKVTGN